MLIFTGTVDCDHWHDGSGESSFTLLPTTSIFCAIKVFVLVWFK